MLLDPECSLIRISKKYKKYFVTAKYLSLQITLYIHINFFFSNLNFMNELIINTLRLTLILKFLYFGERYQLE